MVKEKYRILVFLSLIIAGQVNAQQFNFDSDKKQSTNFNQKIEEAIDKNDVKLMKKILDKDPSLVNYSSKMATISKYSVLSGGKIPLLYDAVDRCLNNKCSFEMVELILKYEPFLYCTFDNLTPFYLILNYLATHKIEICGNAEKLFNLFCRQTKFDLNQKYKDLPPPISYLLSRNFTYTANSYNKDYISSDIIKTFIEHNVSINTRDVNSTSILTYAVITEKTDLISFCINKGADVAIINNDKHDALYYAILNNNPQNVATILNSNYPISEMRLESIGAYSCMPLANEEIRNLLFDKLKIGKKDLGKMNILSKLFADKMLYFISDNYNRNNYEITKEQIPEFVALYKNTFVDEKSIAFENLTNLKKEYIFSFNNLKDFVSANKIFPLFVLNNYSTKYFQNEKQSNDLLIEIKELKFIPQTLHARLISEVENAPISYYNNTCINGSMNELVLLYKNFPSKSQEVEKTTFNKYIFNVSTGNINYSITDYYISIGEEIKSVGNVQYNCSTFIDNFKNPEYIITAQNKLQGCVNNNIILTDIYNHAVTYYNSLLSRYNKALDLIVKNGNTPPYEITKTETSGNKVYINIKVNKVTSTYSTIKFDVQKSGNNYCEYSEFLFLSSTSHCAESLNEVIRRVCIDRCSIENRDFYHMKNIIDFLEKNIYGNWYGKRW